MTAALDHYICSDQRPAVTPWCIFAARRKKFRVVVRGQDWLASAQDVRLHARAEIFSALPLEKHGWDRATTKLRLVARTTADDAVWDVSRGDMPVAP